MPYTAEKPPLAESPDQLRARIPGWGADLDPADRPSVPRERTDLPPTGAHWELPEQQPDPGDRERSIEHGRLTPVFGTSVPLRGLSGRIRRVAYDRYGEGRAAHWLLLIAGDRVDAWESHLRSFATLHPDNPITETGVLAERKGHGIASRRMPGRTDRPHQLVDPIVVGGPWVVGGVAAFLAGRKVVRALRR